MKKEEEMMTEEIMKEEVMREEVMKEEVMKEEVMREEDILKGIMTGEQIMEDHIVILDIVSKSKL